MAAPTSSNSSSQRLQVFLAHQGVCSRRKAMDLIQEGRVAVNGVRTDEPSTPVNPAVDKVTVDGRIVARKSYDYVMLHKPSGYVTTREDPHAEKTVLDLLPENLRHVNPVGRLDKDSEGLLLLTNDGDVANKLTHPRFDVNKIYFVRIKGQLIYAEQKKLEGGILVAGEKTAPAKITNIRTSEDETEFLITIHEGRKRQIRWMLQAVGHTVVYLKRIQQGPLKLGSLKVGNFRPLEASEIKELKAL